ncbi:MAG: T9SS type A sorting domain-containing protein [bacterium]
MYHYLLSGVLFGLMLLSDFTASAFAGDAKIERHESVSTIDLVPGEERGTITQPLLRGTIAGTGQEVLFVLSDASDKDFAEMFGIIRSDALEEAPQEAVEDALFENGVWTFFEDPGLVARLDLNDEDGDGDVTEVLPPVANPNYSPLKRLNWNGKTVTVNVPFVKWGDEPGQELLVDHGSIDPLIRSNPPSPFFVGNGPKDGAPAEQVTNEAALDRYKGGQVVALDLEAMTVTMKLHRATFDHPDVIPYYTVFDASKAPPAGFMGVIHAPKLGNIGRFGDNKAVGRIAQFSNGVRIEAGGPNRFQQGITSYPGGQSMTYTPIWHITWIFFDCDGDGVFYDPEHNVGEGAVPVAGSGIPGFDPAQPETFDPFGMDDKGGTCLQFATQVTGHADGFIEDLGQLQDLVKAGFVVETEGPAGLRLDSPLQPPLIVNCPVPLTVTGGKQLALKLNQEAKISVNPTQFRLHQNYPNPFNPETTISYDLQAGAHVSLKIYNLLGQELITLVDQFQEAGRFRILWHGKDRFGMSVPSGVYIYNLQGAGISLKRKMVVLR